MLVGLPGAGKSTLAPLLAARLGVAAVDLDARIADTEGRPVARIIRESGLAAFRALERRATEALRHEPPAVVAPGGGWITQPDLVALVRPPGRLVHLHVSPATALARMGPSRAERPLLSGDDPLGALEALAASRADAYARADARVDTELLSWQALVEHVTALASAWGVGVG